MSAVIELERQGRVAVIALNRPEAKNALNSELLGSLLSHLEDLRLDQTVGAIVITGRGGVFCAGADLKEAAQAMSDSDFWGGYDRTNLSLRLHQWLPKFPKPVIAAVNGYAVAGGCGVAMSCDLVVAGADAKFGYPEVKRGLVAAMVLVRLTRLMGQRQALELLLTGRTIGAEEALSLGLVNRVVPSESTLANAVDLGNEIASHPASALQFTKELVRQVQEMHYDLALEHARDVNQMIRGTKDASAGVRQFVEGKE